MGTSYLFTNPVYFENPVPVLHVTVGRRRTNLHLEIDLYNLAGQEKERLDETLHPTWEDAWSRVTTHPCTCKNVPRAPRETSLPWPRDVWTVKVEAGG